MPLRTRYIPKKYREYKEPKRFGIIAVHEAEGIEIIQEIVGAFKPELILELGTSWGGLTMALHDGYPQADLYSYDIPSKTRKPHPVISLKYHKVHIRFCDLLKRPYDHLVKKCKDERRKFWYCDNGNKIKEVLTYGVLLRVGDILAVHDWGGEVNFDHSKLDVHHRERNTPEEVESFRNLITDNFEPYLNDRFEEEKCTTRMWIRRK
jgi:cephalosporin hydroxylase